jgi:GrpB-like predicted nucleotidyltransferase (UPF0157 family)
VAGNSKLLGLAQGQLALAPHSSAWADEFAAEAKRIHAAIPGTAFAIDHIGSTAVPGLPAKPILDLAVCVSLSDEDIVAESLCGLGYSDRGLRSGRLFVRCDAQGARTHNLHLYLDGDAEHREQIAFRDALRADPNLRDAYAALKQELVAKLGAAGRERYADAKAAFIKAAIANFG